MSHPLQPESGLKHTSGGLLPELPAPRAAGGGGSGPDILGGAGPGLAPWIQPAGTPGGIRAAVSLPALLQQRWLMAGVFALIAAASIPPIWLFTKPTYKSTAVVRVSPIISRLVYKTEENGVVPLYESYVNTQVSIIRSPTVLQRVLDRPDVQATRWHTTGPQPLLGAAVSPMERLAADLSVQPRPRTQLIDVSIHTLQAGESKLLVDATVDEYWKYLNETSRDEETKLMETLRREQSLRQETIERHRKTRDLLGRQPGLFDSEQLRATLSSELTLLESRRADLVRQVSLMRWKLERRGAAAQGPATAPAGAPAATAPASAPAETAEPLFAEDSEWRRLHLDLERSRNLLAINRQSFGAAHPKIREFTAHVDNAERALAIREQQLRQRPPAATQPSLAATQPASGDPATFDDPAVMAELTAVRQKEIELLDQDIEEQRSKAGSAMELGRIEHLIRHEEKVYNEVSERLNVLEMESKSPARIEVVAHGMTASRPDKDRRLLLSLMAACAAAGCALGGAYLRVLGDSRIREPEQVRTVVRMPFLGQLPELRPAELPCSIGGTRDSAAASAYPASLLEGMRMIRTALMERLAPDQPQVLLATSPMPASGKTSFATILAGSLSLLGKRVLLVEADMRRPSIARRFGLDSEVGLAQILNGTATDLQAIVRHSVWPFDVVPAGKVDAAFDPEILANGVFSRCLARWKAAYHFVLLDGPPLLPVADARILAGHCDGTVLVMRASQDTRAEAMDAYAALAEAGRRVIGTVLIGGRTRADQKYSGGYYAYGRKEVRPLAGAEAKAPPD